MPLARNNPIGIFAFNNMHLNKNGLCGIKKPNIERKCHSQASCTETDRNVFFHYKYLQIKLMKTIPSQIKTINYSFKFGCVL